ncbi:MAG: hypothetical protein ABIN96_06595 [Rubrivivax sp.]
MLSPAIKTAIGAAAIAVASLSNPAFAQTSPAKKELVAKVLQLQQVGIELMARALAEQPARLMMQQAAAALQRVPVERREALARDIEVDVRKYVEDASAVVKKRAVEVAPSTIGALLEERFSEDELKQVIALLESPVNRKFQSMAPEMQKVLAEKLVADTRPEVEPMMRYLELQVTRKLAPTEAGGAASAAPKAAPKAATPKNK